MEQNSITYTVSATQAAGAVTTVIVMGIRNFGGGYAGPLAVTAAGTIIDTAAVAIAFTVTTGAAAIPIGNSTGFAASGNDMVLVIQMQDVNSNGSARTADPFIRRCSEPGCL